MNRPLIVSLAVALLAACGSSDTMGTNDSSTAMERDAGTTPVVDVPSTDSPTQLLDGAVQDGSMRDVTMMIAGVGTMSTVGEFRCAPRLCRDQQVTLVSGETQPSLRRIICNATRTEANLSTIGFTTGDGWAVCGGNTCYTQTSPTTVHAIVYQMTDDGVCSRCGTIIDVDTSTRQLIAPTSMISQSCPL